jgi:phage tail tape-measure protein
METQNKPDVRAAEPPSVLHPATLLKDSGKAIGIGAATGAIAGAVAGALAGAAAWSIWVLSREAVKSIRERAGR